MSISPATDGQRVLLPHQHRAHAAVGDEAHILHDGVGIEARMIRSIMPTAAD